MICVSHQLLTNWHTSSAPTKSACPRFFAIAWGKTVFEYLRETRLRTAMHLLSTTSMSISDVADEIGFSSAANFATAFREQLGVSPSRWRKRHLGQDCGGTSDEMRVGRDSK